MDAPAAKSSNLRTRILAALVLAPVVLGIVWVGGGTFTVFVLALLVVMMREWILMVTPPGRAWPTLGWLTLGVVYLTIPTLCLFMIRGVPSGREITIYLLVVVWATDTGAYFAGKGIGGPKLCPRISPKKTWAGLIGGMVAAAFAGWGVAMTQWLVNPYSAAILGAVLAAISQVGDLFESWVKRRFGVKDSGQLIPGHGGILDRVDGLLFAAVALFFALVAQV